MNDILKVSYWYKYKLVSTPLADFKYGDIMLMDYFPYEEQLSCLMFETLDPEYSSPLDKKHEIRFKDAFGNVYTANSETDIWRERVLY